MALSEIDRRLLQRCLNRKPHAWEDFVDRFLGLIVHVVNHSADARRMQLDTQDVEDVVAEVLLAIVNDDFAILRRFRGESSLATYLTVVSRRIAVRELLKKNARSKSQRCGEPLDTAPVDRVARPESRITDREEVGRLMSGLSRAEAEVVRLHHLEGKSYREISETLGMPENSIGPTLSRARAKMRRSAEASRA